MKMRIKRKKSVGTLYVENLEDFVKVATSDDPRLRVDGAFAFAVLDVSVNNATRPSASLGKFTLNPAYEVRATLATMDDEELDVVVEEEASF